MISENKVKQITTRKSNKDKIMDYLKENPKQITTSDLAKNTGIDIKNISRYLKELESEEYILREIIQKGKIRVVYISLKTRKENNTSRKKPIKNQTKKTSQSPKSKPKVEPNKKTPSISGNREFVNSKFIEQMSQKVELFGRTIPLDKVREIARETLLGHRVMMEGVKSWLGVWKKRYHEYIEDKPEHFLIDKYEKAQETLEFLYKVEKLFKEITNGKNGK